MQYHQRKKRLFSRRNHLNKALFQSEIHLWSVPPKKPLKWGWNTAEIQFCIIFSLFSTTYRGTFIKSFPIGISPQNTKRGQSNHHQGYRSAVLFGLMSKNKILIGKARKIQRDLLGRSPLERVVGIAAAGIILHNDSLFSAQHLFLIQRAAMHAIDAVFFNILAKQHGIFLLARVFGYHYTR